MIKGQVEIQIKEFDKDGKEIIINTIKDNNLICIRALEQLSTWPSTPVFNNTTNFRIVISSTNIAPTISIRTLTSSIFASGDSTPFINSYVYTKRDLLSTTNPSDLVYKQRFVAPLANRTINSIALSDSITLQNNVTATANIFTYLRLTIPIVQTTSQTLDVTYRLFIDWTNSISAGLDINLADVFERALFGPTTYGNSFLISSKLNTAYYNSNVGINFLESSAMSGADYTINGFTTTNANTTSLTRSGSQVANISNSPTFSTFNFLGRFISNFSSIGLFANPSTGIGRPTIGFIRQLNKTTNLGSFTSHSLTSTLATYDVNNLANSSWQPSLVDSPNPDFPSFYLLKATVSGGLGVGRYKIYKSGWGGWYNGAWTGAIADQFLLTDFSYQENDPTFIEDNYSAYNVRWQYTWSSTLGQETFVSYNRIYGVGIYTLTDRALTLVSQWKINNGGLGTYINDIDVAPSANFIYVAMNNGLHRINTTTNTITTLSSDKCLTVCVGFNNEVFATFDTGAGTGRLSGTIGTNWSTPLSLGGAPPVIVWANIWRLFIDKLSATHQLMIVEGASPKGVILATSTTNTNITRFTRHWWSSSTGITLSTAVQTNTTNGNIVLSSDLILFPTHNCVLANNGIWIYLNTLFRGGRGFEISFLFPKDLETDLIDSGYFFSKNRMYTLSNPATIIKGNSLNGSNFDLVSAQIRFIDRGRLGIGLWGQAPITQITTTGIACGDWIKPRLATDGNIFSIVFTNSNHSHFSYWATSTAYRQNTSATSNASTLATISSLNFSIDQQLNLSALRIGIFIKVDIDLTGAPAANIINYTDIGASNTYSLYSLHTTQIGNIKVTHDKRIILFDNQNNLPGAGVRMYSPIHIPNNDMNDILCQTWSWNSTTSTWVDDPLNNGVGKPIHTTTDTLVDGLSINWTDLQSGNTKPLVAGQYYVISRLSAPGQVPVELHTPTLTFTSGLNLRTYAQGTTTISIPNTTASFFVAEAPGGSSPNTNWYSINSSADTNTLHITSVTINGVSASLAYNNSNNIPSAGTILINDNGRIRVNSADINKTLVLNYSYALKYDSTETAAP